MQLCSGREVWSRLEGYVGGGGLLDYDGYFHHGRLATLRLGKPESRPKPQPNSNRSRLVIANEVKNYSVFNAESSVIHKALRRVLVLPMTQT